jgi:peptidoglycan hydrolase CwlO-like protein
MLLALLGAFRYVTAMADALRREIAAVKEESRLFAEKVGEGEARQRHSMANTIQTLVAKQEADIRQLQREAVRQEQLNALEGRLGQALSKIEAKLDRVTETAAEVGAMKVTLAAVTVQLDRLDKKLDDVHLSPRRGGNA